MCKGDVCNAVFTAVECSHLLAFESVVHGDFAFIMARNQEIVAAMEVYRVYLAVWVLHCGGMAFTDCQQDTVHRRSWPEKHLEHTPTVHPHTLNSCHLAKPSSGCNAMNPAA